MASLFRTVEHMDEAIKVLEYAHKITDGEDPRVIESLASSYARSIEYESDFIIYLMI
jgi:hypothetical protein